MAKKKEKNSSKAESPKNAEAKAKKPKTTRNKKAVGGQVINFQGNLDEIHQIACGVDVHKSFIVAVICIHTDASKEPVYIKDRFSTYTKGLRKFADWLLANNCRHVCMESTGVYWVPVFNILEPVMDEVRIVNPKWVKAVKGEKDDTKDAAWICNKYRHGETRASYIPGKEIRDLRNLTRLRTKYVNSQTADKNRLKNVLTQNNYKLDMVFSDTEGVSARKITDLILSGKKYTDADILECVHWRCQADPEDILKAVDGIKLSSTDKVRMRVIRKHMNDTDQCIKKLDSQIDKIMNTSTYQKIIELLITIPGVNVKSAKKIIAELGLDVGEFKNAGALCKWAGLASGSNESAGKKFSVHITKGGKYLKPYLVECAWAAVKSNDPYYRLKYNAIASRQGKKRAIIAIARKILVSIYYILTKGEKWNPEDMNEDHVPRKLSVTTAKDKLKMAIEQLSALKVPASEMISIIMGEDITAEDIISAMVERGISREQLLYAVTGEVPESAGNAVEAQA